VRAAALCRQTVAAGLRWEGFYFYGRRRRRSRSGESRPGGVSGETCGQRAEPNPRTESHAAKEG
jgi:hypothetical protein